jgi:predicted RNA-binding Zn-ribbon protein involved in translation (DUF1610 family)
MSHVTVESRLTLNCSTLGGNLVIPPSAWEKSDMAVLSEITDILKRWDVWRRVEEAPARIDALEKRIAELEAKLQRAPGEACPACGELEFRVTGVQSASPLGIGLGSRNYTFKCQKCGFEDTRLQLPR